MGPDFDRRSIPAEAGLLETIDSTKGCFLGQESVARVHNLGHPPRRAAASAADGRSKPGATVLDDRGDEVGEVTSAARGQAGHGHCSHRFGGSSRRIAPQRGRRRAASRRPVGLARSGHFASLGCRIPGCMRPTPSADACRLCYESCPAARCLARGSLRGGGTVSEDRAVPERRRQHPAAEPRSPGLLARTRRMLRRRPRHLLPDLRGGGRPRPHVLQLVPDPGGVPRLGAEERRALRRLGWAHRAAAPAAAAPASPETPPDHACP